MPTFFQAGVLPAFMQGIYEGDINFKTLALHGDFGLGTFNAVDGEMIAVDGQYYRIDEYGKAGIVSPELCTPFAVVTQFKSVKSFSIQQIDNLNLLNATLDAHIPTQNIFYMMRVDAEFDWIKVRSASCQQHPYKPLAETLPKLQKEFEYNDIKGTLVVTRCPAYSAAVTIAGYHYHFIDQAREVGGHVFDVRIKTAKVTISPIRRFSMVMFSTPEFFEIQLENYLEDDLKKVEQGQT